MDELLTGLYCMINS